LPPADPPALPPDDPPPLPPALAAMQLLATHRSLAAQTVVHEPQCIGSLCRSTQLDPHWLKLAPHELSQMPVEQTSVPMQVPQIPPQPSLPHARPLHSGTQPASWGPPSVLLKMLVPQPLARSAKLKAKDDETAAFLNGMSFPARGV
jgi:hypothetical protein